ncbi:hypothetical protein B5S33_g1909 [[Candida] boidinii]|nr:hypothetical protein B5S33_g1909 [[Candida] boidinii]
MNTSTGNSTPNSLNGQTLDVRRRNINNSNNTTNIRSRPVSMNFDQSATTAAPATANNNNTDTLSIQDFLLSDNEIDDNINNMEPDINNDNILPPYESISSYQQRQTNPQLATTTTATTATVALSNNSSNTTNTLSSAINNQQNQRHRHSNSYSNFISNINSNLTSNIPSVPQDIRNSIYSNNNSNLELNNDLSLSRNHSRNVSLDHSNNNTNHLLNSYNNNSINTINNSNNNNNNNNNSNHVLFGISSNATKDLNKQRNSLKNLGLKRLSSRQHLFIAFCRDISLFVIIKNLFLVWRECYNLKKNSYIDNFKKLIVNNNLNLKLNEIIGVSSLLHNLSLDPLITSIASETTSSSSSKTTSAYSKITNTVLSYEDRLAAKKLIVETLSLQNLTNTRSSEYFLAGVWCIVAGYLSYSILDGLMVRWIVMYSAPAAIVRMLSMSLFIIFLIEMLSIIFNPDGGYTLPAWIAISCVLTVVYIIQNFVTSNLRVTDHTSSLLPSRIHDDSQEDGRATSTTATQQDLMASTPTTFEQQQQQQQQLNSASIQHHLPSINSVNSTISNINGSINNNNNNNTANIITKKLNKVRRTVDLYNITVFAVVPIGLASFLTMIGLIRLVIIMRLELNMKINENINIIL